MKVLILSNNNGGGHNSVAKALAAYLNSKDISADIVDGMSFVSEKLSKLLSFLHNFSYVYIPKAHALLFELLGNPDKVFKKSSFLYKLLERRSFKLYKYIQTNNYDYAICTHVFPGIMLTQVIDKYDLKIKTAIVNTDYNCSLGIQHVDVDKYFVANEYCKKFLISKGVSADKVVISGIPVNENFMIKRNKVKAKEKYCNNVDSFHVLLMGGSMGVKALSKIVKIFDSTQENTELSVVCGNNKKIYKKLSKINNHNLHIYNYTNEIDSLLDSSDFFITKPGGVSITEALQKEIIIGLFQVVDFEKFNYNYFINNNAAIPIVIDNNLFNYLKNFCLDKEKLNEIKSGIEALKTKNSSDVIFNNLI